MKYQAVWILPLLVAVLLFPDTASDAVAAGLELCGHAVIPALFPTMVLTRWMVLMGGLPTGGARTERWMRRFFGLSGSCAPALLMSFVGGYPVGAATVAGLYEEGQLSRKDAECAMTVCNNSGPGFFLSVAGLQVLGSIKAGVVLYLIHVLCAVLLAFALATPERRPLRAGAKKPPGNLAATFPAAIAGSCNNLLSICGLILFFSLILSLLPSSLGPFVGILELSSGVLRADRSPGGFVLCAFYMGWGGFCVHLQAVQFWQELRPRGYWATKLAHGITSSLLALACTKSWRSALLVLGGLVLTAVCLRRFRFFSFKGWKNRKKYSIMKKTPLQEAPYAVSPKN